MSDEPQFDLDHIWHPFTPLTSEERPIHISSAEGIYLITHEGRRIIDAVSSWWVNLHGHANAVISAAISEQASKLEHVIFAGFTHDPAITLSKNLLTILPPNQQRIFFSDNGSTAVEVALKMAMQYWYNKGEQRRTFIALDGAYHGDTFGSMSVGARSIFTDPFRKSLFETEYIPFPDGSNDARVIEIFRKKIQEKHIAGFVFEPLLQGAAGMRMYSAETLQVLVEEADRAGVISIADEVMTGFGRTGKILATDYISSKPDIIVLSKGITGGFMPLGVTSCSEKIVSAFRNVEFEKTFFHGHSYTANPLACAAANASFGLLMAEFCTSQRAMINDAHTEFRKRIAHHKSVADARVLGTVMAIEVRQAAPPGYQNPLRKKIYTYFLERDILLRPLGNVLYVMPPYVISREELERIYSSIGEFLDPL